MLRRGRKIVAFADQSDLAEEGVDGAVGNVHASEAGDALRLLAQVADRGPAAIARQQVGLELTGGLAVELRVEVAAEREEAAPHRAISL